MSIYSTRISSLFHAGITKATQSQFKKKVTRDDTFDIFIFLRNRTFQRNNAHGVGKWRKSEFWPRGETSTPRNQTYIEPLGALLLDIKWLNEAT